MPVNWRDAEIQTAIYNPVEEQEKIRGINARDLVEFSQMVLEAFNQQE